MKNIIVSSLLFVGIVHSQGPVPCGGISLPGTQPAVTAPAGQVEATPVQAVEPVSQKKANFVFYQDFLRLVEIDLQENGLEQLRKNKIEQLRWEQFKAAASLVEKVFVCENNNDCETSEELEPLLKGYATITIALLNEKKEALNSPEAKERESILSKYIN